MDCPKPNDIARYLNALALLECFMHLSEILSKLQIKLQLFMTFLLVYIYVILLIDPTHFPPLIIITN